MPSISETAGLITAAGAEVSAAKTDCNNAQEAIGRAQRALFEAMGEASPGTLIDYQGALDNATHELDKVIRFLDGGMEKGQEYIRKLYS